VTNDNVAHAAVYYADQSHGTQRTRLMGMQMANAGWLAAYLEHGAPGRIPINARDQGTYEAFRAQFPTRRETRLIAHHDVAALSEPGCLILPTPELGAHAALRSAVAPGGFSLCGVTHSLSSPLVLDALRALLVAPVYAWDAVVCTSRAARAVVQSLLDSQAELLERRFGARAVHRPGLPLIPLGIDTARFDPPDRVDRRAAFRATHQLTDNAFVVISLGRMNPHYKAHPVALWRALDRLSRATDRPVVLLQAGWFADDPTRRLYATGAASLAPAVRVVTLERPSETEKVDALLGADVFVSLVDNVQETFGIAPLEAMAAGLPAVASDWDGYRDTLVDGVTGFLVPTTVPPPGSGVDLGLRLTTGVDDYGTFIAKLAEGVAVDIGAAAAALIQLAADPALGARLGAAGRARARAQFDWAGIIPAYEALWTELDARRKRDAAAVTAAAPPVDPFDLYAPYAARSADGMRYRPTENAEQILEQADAAGLGSVEPQMNSQAKSLLRAMRDHGAIAVEAGVAREKASKNHAVMRTLVWLAKLGAVVAEPK
jgi:alpha-maltose-1-phosphate synthase